MKFFIIDKDIFKFTLTFLIFMFFTDFSMGAPKVITTTVGKIGEDYLTSRDVQLSFLIERALFGSQKKINFETLTTESPRFAKEVQAVLLERVIFLEAEAFSAHAVNSSDIDSKYQIVMKNLKNNPLWIKLAPDKSELRKNIERKLRAKRFIQFKGKSSIAPVTDQEAKEYFEKNRNKFGDLPFENFKENIKSFLGRQQVDQRLKDWFEVLQTKYKASNFVVSM